MNHEREIVSANHFPVMGLFWGLLGIILLAVGILEHNSHCSLASAPALALGWGLLLFRRPKIAGRFSEDALCLTEPEMTIPYESIEGLTLDRRPQEPGGKLRPGPIDLVCPAGTVTMPQAMNEPVAVIYGKLLERTASSGSRDVNAKLEPYVAKETEVFGAEHVWTFRARKGRIGRAENRRQRNCFILLGLSALIWILAPFLLLDANKSPESFAWLGFGCMLGFLSLIGVLVSVKSSRQLTRLVPRWHQSSLVVSPSGIAMIQGDLQGEMRWDELRDVCLSNPRLSFAIPVTSESPIFQSLQLVVAGAVVRIYDIYDRPLPSIAKIVRQVWGQPLEMKET